MIYFIETQYLTFHQYGENVPKKLNCFNKLQFAMTALHSGYAREAKVLSDPFSLQFEKT